MSTILLFKDKEVVEGNIDTILHMRVCFQTSYRKKNVLLKKSEVNTRNIKKGAKESENFFPWENAECRETGHRNALSFEVRHNHMHDHLGNASCIFISTESLY